MIALFDFDGVVMDTEPQYTAFWNQKGMEYFGVENFAYTIKGQTLVQIFEKHFPGREEEQRKLIAMVDDLERNMIFEYVPGAFEFMSSLKTAGIPMAIVTSSGKAKMGQVLQEHPELAALVDVVLTGEDFERSKPDPDCFLKGMKHFRATPEETLVFEDSFHGLSAGRASGARVVGLATTNSREAIAPYCDIVIDDFTGFTINDIL
ncbi:MAG: HAD family hydrolase [Bacteroidales bacterium]|nr:HAD family hydrolase [Bacteroidales bacterium]